MFYADFRVSTVKTQIVTDSTAQTCKPFFLKNSVACAGRRSILYLQTRKVSIGQAKILFSMEQTTRFLMSVTGSENQILKAKRK
jgi:hypothetical protein